MRELSKNIDPDVVIEISNLLDDSALFAPVRVHDLAARVGQRVKTTAGPFDRRTDRGDRLGTSTDPGL
jgi:hypothetical protein